MKALVPPEEKPVKDKVDTNTKDVVDIKALKRKVKKAKVSNAFCCKPKRILTL